MEAEGKVFEGWDGRTGGRSSLVARPPRPLIMSASAIEEDDPWLHQPILRPWRRLDWPKCGLGLGPAASSPSPHADECVVASCGCRRARLDANPVR